MTKNSFKFTILTALTCILFSCKSNPINDNFSEDEIAPVTENVPKTEVKASEALVPSAEANAIDAELAAIEAQIQAAQARLTHYQMQNDSNPVNQIQMTGVEAEISHYQSIKSHLLARKSFIQSTVK